eukprot:2203730-Alexandrium_andersonii.AAC.1
MDSCCAFLCCTNVELVCGKGLAVEARLAPALQSECCVGILDRARRFGGARPLWGRAGVLSAMVEPEERARSR